MVNCEKKHNMSYSQSGQDLWVLDLFKSKDQSRLFFVDLAAHDGIQNSNTRLLEEKGWNGLCIEANRDSFEKLLRNRSCECVCCVVLDYDGKCGFLPDGQIGKATEGNDYECKTFSSVIGNIKNIDYLSLDVEGSEFLILKSINFEEINIKAITVEHNKYAKGEDMKNKIYELLTENCFERVKEDVLVDGHLPFEDWYIHKSFFNYVGPAGLEPATA